mgnify:CR=1 FL=1
MVGQSKTVMLKNDKNMSSPITSLLVCIVLVWSLCIVTSNCELKETHTTL